MLYKHALQLSLCLAALAIAGPAHAAPPVTGIWIDHTGRGAVEITQCGANLCGRIVWLKEGANKKGCGIQVIGNARPVGKDTWDGGWIYDPEKGAKYSVELKPIGADKLRVLGYAGSKFFSQTMIWKRAATELQRCDAGPTVTAARPPSDKKAEPAKAAPPSNPKPAGKAPEPKQRAAKSKIARQSAKEAARPRECKLYIAQIGETVSVPCGK